MLQALPNSRFSVDHHPQGTRVKFKDSPMRLAVAAFLGFWLCGWVMGEFTALSVVLGQIGAWLGLVSGTQLPMSSLGVFGFLFMAVWLGGWTVGGLFAMYSFVTLLDGTPRLFLLKSGGLVVERLLGKKTYKPDSLSGVRLTEKGLLLAGSNTHTVTYPELSSQEKKWLLETVLSSGVVQPE